MTEPLPLYPIDAMDQAGWPVVVLWRTSGSDWMGPAIFQRGKTKADRWLAIQDKGLEPMPPRRMQLRTWRNTFSGEDVMLTEEQTRARWDQAPTYFRPLTADESRALGITWRAWPGPLPDPVPQSREGRFVQINRMAFSAAEAAAEMEAERETARAGHGREARVKESPAWWRDATLITHSLRGQITEREVEGRIMRALLFDARDPTDAYLLRIDTNAAVMADLKRAADLAFGDAVADYMPALQRTPADTVNRELEALGWFAEMIMASPIGGKLARILICRAKDMPDTWAHISRQTGYSETRVKQLYPLAIRHLTAIANTGTPLRDAVLRTVKEGNRSYARAR